MVEPLAKSAERGAGLGRRAIEPPENPFEVIYTPPPELSDWTDSHAVYGLPLRFRRGKAGIIPERDFMSTPQRAEPGHWGHSINGTTPAG
jgi:hypothetical protein